MAEEPGVGKHRARRVVRTLKSVLKTRAVDAAQPLYAVDAAGKLVFANRPYRNLLALIRRAQERGVSGLTPPEAIHARILESGQAIELEESAIGHPDGMVYASRHFPVLNGRGRPIGVCGYYTSRSPIDRALAESSAALRVQSELLDTLSAWTFETDAALSLTRVSGGFAEATGLDPVLANGRYLLEIGRLEDAADDVRSALLARAAIRNASFHLIHSDGEERVFRLDAIARHSEDGRFLGYRGTATAPIADGQAPVADEASRAEVEAALKELTRRIDALVIARDQAISARAARDRFLATVSHELRTPLNAVIGFSEMCATELFGALPEPYLGYSQDILSASRHLMRLVDDLMDLARIERDQLKVELEGVGVKGLIESTSAIVAFEAERKDIDITVAEPKSSLVVWADPTRTRQILVNLLTNAIKFTDPGGAIRIDTNEGPDGMIGVTVTDTGIGIASDAQAGIFEVFRRAVGDGDKAPEGLGIGLHLARRLARLMGGDIDLQSVPGEGSQFTIWLPSAAKASRAEGKANDQG